MLEFDLYVFGLGFAGEIGASIGAIGRAPQSQAGDDVLRAEAFELQVQNAFEREGHHRVPVGDEMAALADFGGGSPSVEAEGAFAVAAEVEAQNLGVVEGWHLAEPAHEVCAAGHCVVDRCVGVGYHCGFQSSASCARNQRGGS